MAAVRIAVIALAALLTLTGCGDPGTVVDKTTVGLEVTGQHFLHCKRIAGTTVNVVKVHVTYKEYVSTKIGDPC